MGRKLLRLTPALLFMAALNVLLAQLVWRAFSHGIYGVGFGLCVLAATIAADYGFVKLVRES